MSRQLEIELREKLNETNFSFIENGIYTLKEIYTIVENTYKEFCDNNYLCIQNCQNGNKDAEWNHVVRGVLQTAKRKGRVISVQRGTWKFI
jgi:hypothetical protein